MIINLIGECDKRPVIYTFMKICQTLGDVLVITSNGHLKRLSDTRESGGHYQNTMIAIVNDSVDEFMEEFEYGYADFDFVIIDGLPVAEADITVYVKGMKESEFESDMLEYVEGYETIPLYEGKMTFQSTLWACEEFEAYGTMNPINEPIAEAVATILAKKVGKSVTNLTAIGMQPTTVHKPKNQLKIPVKFGKKKGGKKR